MLTSLMHGQLMQVVATCGPAAGSYALEEGTFQDERWRTEDQDNPKPVSVTLLSDLNATLMKPVVAVQVGIQEYVPERIAISCSSLHSKLEHSDKVTVSESFCVLNA